ncbi:MAG: indole-3-glycerol phosphate synthase TrpC [Fimbriimonadaceae bacterium]
MSYLDRIYATKREEVEAARRRVPVSDLRSQAVDQPPTRGFLRALQRAERPVALIAEVKAASPSQGSIRPDLDPASVARTYAAAGAQALSVLTDGPYFQGSPANLRAARASCDLPVLRKDFLYDPYQIFEARAMGADAVLLIAAMLADPQIEELHGLAAELGMDALVEVFDEEEAERAVALKCPLIGVNNRDLSNFEVDLSVSERVLPILKPHATTVSESALSAREHVDRVAAAGARAVLIGTAFCASPDIGGKVREVMGW